MDAVKTLYCLTAHFYGSDDLFYVYLILYQFSWYNKILIIEVIFSIGESVCLHYCVSIVLGEKKNKMKFDLCCGIN